MTRFFNRILPTALLLLFISVLTSVSSCDKSDDTTLAVSVAKSTGNALAGSYYVTVQCSGTWSLSLSSTTGSVSWATLSPTSGTGDNSKVLLSYEANESETSRSLTICLESSGRQATCDFTQSGVSNSSGSGSGSGSGGDDEGTGYGEDATSCGWLELPATHSGDGLTFYYHTADFSGTTFRNYSFYWDKTNHLSRWVAYPLNAWSISSGSRSNTWGLVDPLVPAEEQADMSKSYTGNYDRGHQIPSADRLDYEPNTQTFYPTNMTPQRSNFNQNIWANVESKVRNWAKNSDTLYVVTGCVIDGYTSSTTDKNGMDCPIPVAYYKVVLRYSTSTTIGYSGYMGCAIYMDHKDYSDTKVYASYAMSIDDLEEKLGIDFFVNLPDKIGETAAANVEKQDPTTVSWWGFDN